MKNDIQKTLNCLGRLLARPPLACFGLAISFALPPELYSLLRQPGLEEGLLVQLAWSVPLLGAQVWFLAALGPYFFLERASTASLGLAMARVFGAELLLGLKAGNWLMAGMIPGLFCLSLIHPGTCQGMALPCILLLAGLVPGLAYFLRRMLAPAFILWKGSRVLESLSLSRDLVAGRDIRALGFIILFEAAAAALAQAPDLAGDLLLVKIPLLALCLSLGFFLQSAWVAGLYAALRRSK